MTDFYTPEMKNSADWLVGATSESLTTGGKGEIRTHGTPKMYTGFRVQRIRPLCHLSCTHIRVLQPRQVNAESRILAQRFSLTP